MEAREKWIAKSVDELRIKTNPKVTYEGVTLGGNVQCKIEVLLEKSRSFTLILFILIAPERYFTTPVGVNAPTVRSQIILTAK